MLEGLVEIENAVPEPTSGEQAAVALIVIGLMIAVAYWRGEPRR